MRKRTLSVTDDVQLDVFLYGFQNATSFNVMDAQSTYAQGGRQGDHIIIQILFYKCQPSPIFPSVGS